MSAFSFENPKSSGQKIRRSSVISRKFGNGVIEYMSSNQETSIETIVKEIKLYYKQNLDEEVSSQDIIDKLFEIMVINPDNTVRYFSLIQTIIFFKIDQKDSVTYAMEQYGLITPSPAILNGYKNSLLSLSPIVRGNDDFVRHNNRDFDVPDDEKIKFFCKEETMKSIKHFILDDNLTSFLYSRQDFLEIGKLVTDVFFTFTYKINVENGISLSVRKHVETEVYFTTPRIKINFIYTHFLTYLLKIFLSMCFGLYPGAIRVKLIKQDSDGKKIIADESHLYGDIEHVNSEIVSTILTKADIEKNEHYEMTDIKLPNGKETNFSTLISGFIEFISKINSERTQTEYVKDGTALLYVCFISELSDLINRDISEVENLQFFKDNIDLIMDSREYYKKFSYKIKRQMFFSALLAFGFSIENIESVFLDNSEESSDYSIASTKRKKKEEELNAQIKKYDNKFKESYETGGGTRKKKRKTKRKKQRSNRRKHRSQKKK